MYTLYFLASITTFYYIYTKFKRLFSIKSHKFEDLELSSNSTNFEFLDITYDDYTREFIEDIDEFDLILTREKPIKYATVNYSIDDNQYSVLFNKSNLLKLSTLKFPFYDDIVKLPLYREVEKAVIFINDIEYDITRIFHEFAGPKLNYHSDIVTLNFEDIIDYSQDFPELKDVTGVINIDDNLGYKHVFKYPGEFVWNENLLN